MLSEFFGGLDWSVLTNILKAIIPAIFCLTIHELCHGLVALKLGDPTAKNMGRLTLNPIKHIDPLGLLAMAIFKIGYAKPVPANPRNFKNPKLGMAITAFAGPASNVILASVVLLIMGLLSKPIFEAGEVGIFFYEMLSMTAYLSCALAVFNMLPIPPLDGSKVLLALLPDKTYYKLLRYERYGFIVLIAFVYLNVLTEFLGNATMWLFDKLSFFFNIGLSIYL